MIFFVLSSCENNGCIEAEDFGDISKQIIEVLPYQTPNCKITDLDRNVGYQTIVFDSFRKCLQQGIYEANPVPTSNPTTNPPAGCILTAQYDIAQETTDNKSFRELCEKQCRLLCESNKTESRWVVTDPKGTYGNSVDILPNSLIYVTASGSIKLQEGYGNATLVNGCISSVRNYQYLGAETNCASELPNGVVDIGDYLLQISPTGNPDAKTLYNLSQKNLVLFQRYPENYNKSHAIPLNSDPDYTNCIAKYPNNPTQISCSEGGATDSYSASLNASNSSQAFDFGTDKISLIANGGYLRSNNFDAGISEVAINDNNSIISTQGLTTSLILNEITSKDKFIELKLGAASNCSTYPIDNLDIIEINSEVSPPTTKRVYSIANLQLTKTYTNLAIPYYKNSKIRFSINNSVFVDNGGNCHKDIIIKTENYHDVVIPNSGFIQFKMKDLVNYSFDDLFGEVVSNPTAPVVNNYMLCQNGNFITKIYTIVSSSGALDGIGFDCGYNARATVNGGSAIFLGSSSQSIGGSSPIYTTAIPQSAVSGLGFKEIEVTKDTNNKIKVDFDETNSSCSASSNCKKFTCSGGKIAGFKAQFDSDSIKGIALICQNNAGPIASDINSCALRASIINQNGEKFEVVRATQAPKTYIRKNSSSALVFPTPTIANAVTDYKIKALHLGLLTYNDINKSSISSSQPSCYSQVIPNPSIAVPANCALNASSCSINAGLYTDSFIGNLPNCALSGNGENSSSATFGGGGGGNVGGAQGAKGSSFVNPEFISNHASSIIGNSSEGFVKIKDSNNQILFELKGSNPSLNFTSYNLNLATSSSKIINFEIKGGGGGGNSNPQIGCGTAQQPNNNDGNFIAGSIDFSKFVVNNTNANPQQILLALKAGVAGGNSQICEKILNDTESQAINGVEAFEFLHYGLPVIYSGEEAIYEENPECQSSNYSTTLINSFAAGNGSTSITNTPAGTQNFNAISCHSGNGYNHATYPGGAGNGLGGYNEMGGSYYNPQFHNKKPGISTNSYPTIEGTVKISNYINLAAPLVNSSGATAILNTSITIDKANFNVEKYYEICGQDGKDWSSCVLGSFNLANIAKNYPSIQSVAIKSQVGSSTAFNGGGSGGDATFIYAEIGNIKKIIAIAGGGGGDRGTNDYVGSLSPILKVKIPGFSDPLMTFKYNQGNNFIDGNQKRFVVLDDDISPLTGSFYSDSHIFNAPAGYKISKIIFASYGNPIINGENFKINKDCHYLSTKQQVANLCLNQTSCTINFSNFASNITQDQFNSTNCSQSKKLAIKVEFAKTNISIEKRIITNASATITLAAPNNGVINDIVFASYGNQLSEFSVNSKPISKYNSSCEPKDTEERLKVMCLGKKLCQFTNADLGALKNTTSCNSNQATIIFTSKTSFSATKNNDLINTKLKGGDGYVSSGAAGSASYISVVRSDEVGDTNREDFVVIAGGGQGLPEASTTNANYLVENVLKTYVNGFRIAATYEDSPPPPTRFDYYEYENAADPLQNLVVGTTNYTREIFVRKGQILRISPLTFEKYWNSKEGPKECGIGMVAKITPRPAVLCVSNPNKEVNIANPNCVLNYLASTSSVSLSGASFNTANTAVSGPSSSSFQANGCVITETCASEAERLAAWNYRSTTPIPVGITYCPNHSCAVVTCTGGSATTARTCTTSPANSSCSYVNAPANISAGTKDTFYNATTCANCQNIKKSAGEAIPVSKITGTDECYNFDDSDNLSVDKLLTRLPTSPPQDIITATDIDKYKIKPLDKGALIDEGLYKYKNFGDIKKQQDGSGSFYTTTNTIALDDRGALFGLYIGNNNFKDLKFDAPQPSTRQDLVFRALKSASLNNGDGLSVALCKESSDSSLECQGLTLASSNKKLILNPKSPAGSTIFYNFNSSGEIEKKVDFTSASGFTKCTIPNSFSNNSNFICFADDFGNQNEMAKYRLAFKIEDSSPIDNHGSYKVEVKAKNIAKNSMGIVNTILRPILENLDGVRDNPTTPDNEFKPGILESFYKYLINNGYFQNILSLVAVLAISFFGMGYLMGINEIKHSEIVKIIIKIGFVYLFVSPSFGWAWFNTFFVGFFKNSVDFLCFLVAETFDSSLQIKNSLANNDFFDKTVLFDSVNNVLNLIFSDVVQNKVLALLFSSIFGWIYFIIIFYCFVIYLYAIANSVLLYITCQVVTSILMVLGPIMFVFLFFKVTKDIFDNWIKALIGFGLQQIFLVLTLEFFNNLIIGFLKLALGYKVCWSNVLSMNLILTKVSLFNFWTVAGTNAPSTFHEMNPDDSFGNDQNMPSLYLFLILFIVVSLMKKFIELFTNLAVTLAGGIKASTVGGDVANLGKGLLKGVSEKVNSFYQATAGRALDNVDNYLFASGKIAKQERIASAKKFKEDMQTRSKLNSEGNAAVSAYKQNNALSLSQKSQSEQKAILQNVKKNAIQEYAKDNGIKNVDALMNKTGLNYTGTNVFGAAFQAGKQAVKSGGNLINSTNDKQVSASFSKSEANSAIKLMNMNTQGGKEAKEFIENVEKGNLHVNKGKIETARSVAIKAVKSPLVIAKAIANPTSTAKSGISKAASIASMALKPLKKDEVKQLAVSELEKAGKISTYQKGLVNNAIPQALKNWARTDKEKSMIREKMREISSQKEVGLSHKITSQSVVRDLKATQGYVEDIKKFNNSADFNNKDKSLRAYLNRAKERVKNTLTKDSGLIKEDKNIDMMKKNALELGKKNDIELAKAKDDKKLNGELIDKIDKNIKESEEFKRFNLADEMIKNIKNTNNNQTISVEFKNKVENSGQDDLRKYLKAFEGISDNNPLRTPRVNSVINDLENIKKQEVTKIPELKKLVTAKDEVSQKYIEAENKEKIFNDKKLELQKIYEPATNADKPEQGYLVRAQQIFKENNEVKENYEQKGVVKNALNQVAYVVARPFGKANNNFSEERKKYKKALSAIKDYKKLDDVESFKKFCEKNEDSKN